MIKAQSHPRITALLAGLLVVVVAAGIALRWPEGEKAATEAADPVGAPVTEPATPPVEADSSPLHATATAVTASAPAEAAIVDLEALTLQERFDLLGDRARAGDAVAACELGKAVGDCRMHRMIYYPSAFTPPPSATGTELERFIEREALRQENGARMERICQAMSPAHMAEGALFTARAGLAGHGDSLIAFAQLPQSAAAEFMASPVLIDLYRSQLWPALHRAFGSDQPQVATLALLQLASPMGSPLAGVVPEAYRDPAVAAELLRQISSDLSGLVMPPHRQSPPSPEVINAAAAWLDELFDGRLPDLEGASQPLWRLGRPESASTCSTPEAWVPAA